MIEKGYYNVIRRINRNGNERLPYSAMLRYPSTCGVHLLEISLPVGCFLSNILNSLREEKEQNSKNGIEKESSKKFSSSREPRQNGHTFAIGGREYLWYILYSFSYNGFVELPPSDSTVSISAHNIEFKCHACAT